MSDNLPELRREEPTREVARTDTDSWTNVFGDVVELARGIADTEFVPRGLRGNIAATTAAILYGREVGLPPMTSLNQTHVIEGKPSMAAEAMRAMVFAAGHELEVLESTGSICRMRARRRGTERWTPDVVWTIDMARAAGLLSKNNWKNHPRRMLQARCSSELCELYFPDVVLGFKSVEEMQDEVDADGPAGAAAEPGTKVARKRTTTRKAAAKPAAPEKPAERPVMDGPPLPGEPGYDDVTPAPASVAEGPESAGGEAGGEAAEPPVGDQEQTCPCGGFGDAHVDGCPNAPVDAEIVEDPPPPIEEPAEPRGEVDTHPKPGPSSRAQHRMLFTRLDKLGVGEDERHRISSVLIGREIDSFNRMSREEAGQLIETLGFIDDRAALDQLVRGVQERQS